MGQFANTMQAEAWNGYEGAQWARSQKRWDAVNDGFNQLLLDAAAISGTDTVLDVGCGAGRTTRLAAGRAARGRALGLDLSAPMLERARESAVREGVSNVAFVQGDAQVHPLDAEAFDAVISRYGMTFFGDPVAAFANLHRALRPSGRLAFICAAEAEANEWLTALASLKGILPLGGFGKPGGPGMFSLTDPGRIRDLLAASGFDGVNVQRVEAAGKWGADPADAAAFLLNSGPGRHLLDQVTPPAQETVRQQLTAALQRHEADGGVWLRSSSWLVTAERGGVARN
ncbi:MULTISPECIES: class I SAM-dependent methyltransferase [Streptomyces]|uniref:class I SAM-dependent methyltransferase n=1 Tax=Streptomyces TaxID=1883 RepID=UPI001E2FB280|nr:MULTISPECIES: class I SAM-dependent methyltransferase [Streptomyces]UFQ19954.1 class I SAM-dependent methyltransferase [Streptomyces huasconensis]WCL89575.1 class I SAM-dependent methyltransferase [Streptomyces sp. JCM 35825]